MAGVEYSEFDPVWLLDRVSMDVESLMHAQQLTRAGVAEHLREAGCHVGRDWVDALVEGRLINADLRDLIEVFYAVRRRELCT